MSSRLLLNVCVVTLVTLTAILIATYRKSADKKLLHSFERNVNRSLCVLCLGKDTFYKTLDFQLDYNRHADLDQYSNFLSKFLLVMKRLFDLWTNQPIDKIFFGTLILNGANVRAVAKNPGHENSNNFEQMVINSSDIDTIITNGQWKLLLPFMDRFSLNICSKDNIEKHLLLKDFFSSVIGVKNNVKSHLWVASHLSVEFLVLKVLNGYRYVPDLFGTCGHVYFVEDCGRTLQYHLNQLNLNNRLFVAKELLKLALELTDGTAHTNYSFYLTDLTADNIALQFDKTSGILLSLKVIDWSDVIVVANDHSLTKNYDSMIHYSEHVDCGQGCLTYSKEDICHSRVSDHNVYAVCKEFLSVEGGLLHGIIDEDVTKNIQDKEIESLVKHCVWYKNVEKHSDKNRLDTAKLIISEIQQIVDQGVYKIDNNK